MGAGWSLNIIGLAPKCFGTFYLESCHLALHLFTGHQSSKPDVISQLEREEKLRTTEASQAEAGRHSGGNRAGGVLVGHGHCSAWVIRSPHSSLRESHHITPLRRTVRWLPISLRTKPKVFKMPGGPVVFVQSPGFTSTFFCHFLFALALPALLVPHT